MSYNIDDTQYLGSARLRIDPEKARRFLMARNGDLPSHCFLTTPGAIVDSEIVHPHWSGEWSGHGYERGVIHAALALTTGAADLLFTWEGGDSVTGLRVIDGVVTEHHVVVTLGGRKDGGK